MAKNGHRPKVQDAWDRVMQARVTLRLAKAKGDSRKIAECAAEVEAATANVYTIHRQRFERLAAEHGGCAVARLDKLTKIVSQPRYHLNPADRAAIMEPIQEAVAELDAALARASLEHAPKKKPARRAIVFRELSA